MIRRGRSRRKLRIPPSVAAWVTSWMSSSTSRSGPGRVASASTQLGEELRTAGSGEVPSGIGRPRPQPARRRHRPAPPDGGQHRAPQPARVIVVAVDPHPRRVRIVRGVDPFREQRGLAVSRGRAQQRHVDRTVELAPQPRAVDQVRRKLRDRDLGFGDAPHRHHPQAAVSAAAGVRGSAGTEPGWPCPPVGSQSGVHRDEVASSCPDDQPRVVVVPVIAGGGAGPGGRRHAVRRRPACGRGPAGGSSRCSPTRRARPRSRRSTACSPGTAAPCAPAR